MPDRYALGLDIGGTFTDFVLVDRERDQVISHKHLTTYPDPSLGALQGLDELMGLSSLHLADLDLIVHSTTLVTNAIIERRGERAGLLTTAGFVSLLDLGREQRYDAYDLFLEYPEPLIPTFLRREVHERTLADGSIHVRVRPEDVVTAAQELVEAGAQALAICFLHAYRNPENERAAAAAIRARFPQLPLSLSSEVAPVMGEWERLSTTVADAYVRRTVDEYVQRLASELAARGFGGRFSLMLSEGGATSPATARAFPIRLLESGPAAGVLAAAEIGRRRGLQDLLALDMGGTTAKASLVEEGAPRPARELEVARVHRFKPGSGLPIRIPSIELLEIGAGGGSIGWVDDLGLLRVGPRSAAAEPGPACYGLGGEEPTVTDADLLLGYLDPEFFLGGQMRLDVAAARQAVERLAHKLGLDVPACAAGICAVVNENMAAAARLHVIERGHDPRRFVLIASGGAGPCHALGVARLLGVRQVILPMGAGTLSSVGCLTAPLSFALDRTAVAPLEGLDWEAVEALLGAMEVEARGALAAAGAQEDRIDLHRSVDMRMVGQIHHIRVPLPHGRIGPHLRQPLVDAFHASYQRLFAVSQHAAPLEVVTWHVVARQPASPPAGRIVSRAGEEACKGRRRAYFAGAFVETPVYDRYTLQPGAVVSGPAIVEERESTALLHPGDYATVDHEGNLVVEVGE